MSPGRLARELDRAGSSSPGPLDPGRPTNDRSEAQLSDEPDREELRRRYYGLLQEVRVLLPGVQVFVAFLLTAPFAQRFGELDHVGLAFYAVSLVAGVMSVIAFVTPTAFHRFGDRRSRSARLLWAIRTTRVGIACMAVSLETAVFVICRFIFGTGAAVGIVAGIGAVMAGAWVALPLSQGRGRDHRGGRDRKDGRPAVAPQD